MSGPRNYTPLTLKRLYGRSGNQCAFPGCDQLLANEDNAANSNICHIEAAEPGGQRYNSRMTNSERADYPNLILLCPSHHKVTDDEGVYTVAKLKEMKAQHETMVGNRVSARAPLNRKPSLLADVIKRICSIDIDTIESGRQTEPFAIDVKIRHNKVVRHKVVIEEHAVYAGKLQKLYAESDKAGADLMGKVLRNISSLYAKQKGIILGADTSLENIQRHADDLIEAVERKLHDLIDSSPNADSQLSYEEVEFALTVIIVDAFMRCKLLEEP